MSGKYHYIQYHHIFPKSLLKEMYETREINEIANMAFIAGRTNRKISNKEPVEYLPKIIADQGESALTAHGVPLDKDLWRLDNYRSFLESRRMILSETVNRFIGSILA